MISGSSGEVTFADLRILPQDVLGQGTSWQTHALSAPGWSQHVLGIHYSDRGAFEVEVLSDPLFSGGKGTMNLAGDYGYESDVSDESDG